MKRKQRLITNTLFIIYLMLLTWIILMKTEFTFADIYQMRSTNFIPFEGTAIVNGQLYFREIYLNVLIFVPFGIYLSMVKLNWSFIQKVIPIFLVSLSFEILQYILAIGATDITDLLGNTLGGIIGIIFYTIVKKKFKNKTNHFFNLLAGVGTFIFIVLFGILLLVNF